MKLTEKQKQALIAIASNERFGTDTLRSSEYNFSVSVLNALVKKGLAEKSKMGTIPVWTITRAGNTLYFHFRRVNELQEILGDNRVEVDGKLQKISDLDSDTVCALLYEAKESREKKETPSKEVVIDRTATLSVKDKSGDTTLRTVTVLLEDTTVYGDFELKENDALILNGFTLTCSGRFTFTHGAEVFKGTLLEYAKSRKDT